MFENAPVNKATYLKCFNSCSNVSVFFFPSCTNPHTVQWSLWKSQLKCNRKWCSFYAISQDEFHRKFCGVSSPRIFCYFINNLCTYLFHFYATYVQSKISLKSSVFCTSILWQTGNCTAADKLINITWKYIIHSIVSTIYQSHYKQLLENKIKSVLLWCLYGVLIIRSSPSSGSLHLYW